MILNILFLHHPLSSNDREEYGETHSRSVNKTLKFVQQPGPLIGFGWTPPLAAIRRRPQSVLRCRHFRRGNYPACRWGWNFLLPEGGASVVFAGTYFRVTVGVAEDVAVGNAVGVIHAASVPPSPDHKSYRACPKGPTSACIRPGILTAAHFQNTAGIRNQARSFQTVYFQPGLLRIVGRAQEGTKYLRAKTRRRRDRTGNPAGGEYDDQQPALFQGKNGISFRGLRIGDLGQADFGKSVDVNSRGIRQNKLQISFQRLQRGAGLDRNRRLDCSLTGSWPDSIIKLRRSISRSALIPVDAAGVGVA